jgi:hypothetical protein
MATARNGNEEQEGSMSEATLLAALSSIALAGCVSQGLATDVTQQRLENPEPQNWLTCGQLI